MTSTARDDDDALRAAYSAAERRCREEPDPTRAYQRASSLRDDLDEFVGKAAELRAEMAFRLAREEGLSISQLAARLGLSKPRAGQLVTTAKAVLARRHAASLAPKEGEQ